MKIRLADYSLNWHYMFEQEAKMLKSIFADDIITIEHFGSTAIPGMKAKPVIDIMCIVRDIKKVDMFNNQMTTLHYDVAGEWGIEGRRLFRKGGENRTHHIHFFQYNNPNIERHLVFRDYLLAHPKEATVYSEFKEHLAQKYDDTRDYSPAKKAFVSEMEKKALNWHRKLMQK